MRGKEASDKHILSESYETLFMKVVKHEDKLMVVVACGSTEVMPEVLHWRDGPRAERLKVLEHGLERIIKS